MAQYVLKPKVQSKSLTIMHFIEAFRYIMDILYVVIVAHHNAGQHSLTRKGYY